MWIVPKNLQLSLGLSAQDMEVSNSDSNESLAHSCEQHFTWRGKPSLVRTWLQRWKKVTWMQHLFGRILKLSMQNRFEAEYISSLLAIPANHSQLQENEKEQMTPDIFGRILNESFRQLDLFGVSLKTSQDTLQLDSPQFTEAYEIWVTQLRLDCLQRQKSVRRISGSDCLSWPTPDVTNKEESAETAKKRMALHKKTGRPTGGTRNLHQVVNWATPEAQNQEGYQTMNGKVYPRLGTQAKWPTPNCRDCTREKSIKRDRLPDLVRNNTNGKSGGKLNPDWVEQLMGLPVGWTDCDY